MSEASASDVLNSLQHLCRICLHRLGEIKIFGEPLLDSTISLCLDILVLSNDGGPQSICCDCKDKLDGIMIFRLIGERSKKQLELFLGRFEDYYTAQVPDPESVECQPDVSTFPLHTNDIPNDLMVSLKEAEMEQIENELLENETEQISSPPSVKQEIDSEVLQSVIQKTSAYPVARTNSSILTTNVPIHTPGEYNDVTNMKISVRTDLISNRNGSSDIPAGLDNDLPSTSGINGNRVLLKAKTESSVEKSEHKFVVPKNLNAVRSNGIYIIKKEELTPSKIVKQRSRRTSLEPCPPPICEICNKLFASRTSLYLHNRLHTQEKAHICSQCNKIFSSSTELSRHIRVHTGEKPYTCEICEKSFTQKVSLRKHQEKLHPVQKFEAGTIKPELGDSKSGLVNEPQSNTSKYFGGLVNQPDFRVGDYPGSLINPQGIGPSGSVIQPNRKANKYDNTMLNQPQIGPGEFASGLMNQPNVRVGESEGRLANQLAIGAGEYANRLVNYEMAAANENGDVSVDQIDFGVSEQVSDPMKQSIKVENSFRLSDVDMNHFT